jgi:signal transduction histidine kinase
MIWYDAPMLGFRDMALCLLGAAVVIDAALLLVLSEGRNRRRIASALLTLTGGALLFHVGFFGSLLFADVTQDGVLWLESAWQAMVGLGALVMPSALLHWLLRLHLSGLHPPKERAFGYLALYLPVLALPWVLTRSHGNAEGGVLGTFGTTAIIVYVVWVSAANLAAAVGLFLLRGREDLGRARRVLGLMVGTLLLSTLLLFTHTAAPFGLDPAALEVVWLLAVLSPALLSLLFGYFVVRFNFLQIVVERSLIYAAMLVALALLYHFFWQQLWSSLSAGFRVDLSILAAAALIILIFLIEPARRRMSEALRYLFGERMERLRRRSRDLALEMSKKTGEPKEVLLDWFTAEVARVLGCAYAAAWEVREDEIIARGGDTGRLEDAKVVALFGQMVDEDISLGTRRAWHTDLLEQCLIDADASMIVLLDHERIAALLVFGRTHAHSLNEEQKTAGRMLVEQLGITITNGILQQERLAQERRLAEQSKLSMLGMVAGAVVHEVKNPLSSIKTISTLLAEELGPESQYKEELSLIRGEVDRLSETVTQMLSFVRPASGGGEVVSLVDALKGAVSLMQHMAKKRGVTISLQSNGPHAEVHAPPASIREIFFNLIGNAIDAAESTEAERGEVAVRIDGTDGAISVTVADNGPGISPADADGIFEPFYTTKAEGTGLGLAIARERAESIDATLEYHPRERGGTVFTVRFDTGKKSADEARER